MNISARILKKLDPSISVSRLDAETLDSEVMSAIDVLVEDWKSNFYEVPSEIALKLSGKQIAQYLWQKKISSQSGKWSKGDGADGCSYKPFSPQIEQGIICGNCVHYQQSRCEIVEGSVGFDGWCKFFVVPDSLIKPRYDAIREDGKIIKWNGLDIAVTHEPGDKRFSDSAPMKTCYGRINRSWGGASDGKAIDCYVHPGFSNEDKNPVYRVTQRNPETLEEDEYKYFFGYSDARNAVDDYIYHAGSARFGSIKRVSLDELQSYRKDIHNDSDPGCGCEACQMKAKRRKRQKRKPQETQEAKVDSDPEEEDDELSLLSLKAQKLSNRYIKGSIKTIGDWISEYDTLQSARSALEKNPGVLFDLLPGGLEKPLTQAMVLSELIGRDEILQQLKRNDSLSDSLPIREDAIPEWLKQPFAEAIKAFRRRVVVPDNQFRKTQEGYADWAFTVAGVTKADLLEDTKWLIDKSLEDGTSFDTFKEQWARLIGRKGWTPGESRMKVIFDTNIRSANGTGRGKQMLDPEVAKRAPYILWRWRDSPQPRPNHQALHNKAIPSDNSFWQQVRFPCGYSCKCSGFAVSKGYCERNGIEILKTPPDPLTIAEPGFRYPLDGLSDKERQAQKEEFVSRVDEKLRDRILG